VNRDTFNAIWDMLADRSICDARGSCEYDRVASLVLDAEDSVLAAWLIYLHCSLANSPVFIEALQKISRLAVETPTPSREG